MTLPSPPETAANLRQRALSRWDNEGGAISHPETTGAYTDRRITPSDDELVHLRTRVIALENVVIALLAAGTPRQSSLAGEIADLIRPRDGSVAHPLTMEAAHLIDGLVQRSRHFSETEGGQPSVS